MRDCCSRPPSGEGVQSVKHYNRKNRLSRCMFVPLRASLLSPPRRPAGLGPSRLSERWQRQANRLPGPGAEGPSAEISPSGRRSQSRLWGGSCTREWICPTTGRGSESLRGPVQQDAGRGHQQAPEPRSCWDAGVNVDNVSHGTLFSFYFAH